MGTSGLVIVTGGAGFIGSHLVERLLAEGHRVAVVDDLSTGTLDNLRSVRNDPRLTVETATVSGSRRLAGWMRHARGVFHLAAAVGVELVVRSPIHVCRANLRETEVVLELASQRRVPVLLTSTSEVYGRSARPEFAEEDDLLIGPPTHPRWTYACSKLMDEFLAMAYAQERGLPVVVTRIFNTVGPRQTGRYGMVLPRFIDAARRGVPLRVYGTGRQRRCFCWVLDTVEALVRLFRCPEAYGQVFNVGSTEETTILGLARLVIRLLGSSSKIERVPYAEAYGPGFEDMQRRRPRVTKLARYTGFRPRTPLKEIILRTAGAMRDAGAAEHGTGPRGRARAKDE
jgi:UDP-glucose 4-epimerase